MVEVMSIDVQVELEARRGWLYFCFRLGAAIRLAEQNPDFAYPWALIYYFK
jgi:hypothetical protein